jgi:hypothetical protein
LLLAVPFFFHTLSLYRGEIQIFPLSAFGLLNVRYGLPHLVIAALLAPAALPLLARFGRARAIAAFVIKVALQYGIILGEGPSQMAVYQEGFRNGVNSRAARDRAKTASWLRENPRGGVTLMQSGSLGPVVSKSDLRFADTIHEGAIRWHQIESGIPPDVTRIIFEEGDALDERIRGSEPLLRDFREKFRLSVSVGKIHLYARE